MRFLRNPSPWSKLSSSYKTPVVGDLHSPSLEHRNRWLPSKRCLVIFLDRHIWLEFGHIECFLQLMHVSIWHSQDVGWVWQVGRQIHSSTIASDRSPFYLWLEALGGNLDRLFLWQGSCFLGVAFFVVCLENLSSSQWCPSSLAHTWCWQVYVTFQFWNLCLA